MKSRAIVRSLLLAALLLTRLGGIAAAQDYRIESWTTDDGLPQRSVNSVVQTRDGFIWIATFGGLARYDGARFDTFNRATTPSLRSSRFTGLFEARDGALWAATEGQGVARYKDGAFRMYTTQDGLPDDSAKTFFYADDGRLLIDSVRGTAVWTGDRFVPFEAGLPSETRGMWALDQTKSGAIWYLDKTGAHKYERGRVTEEFLTTLILKWFFVDRDGRLWIEFDEGGTRRLAVVEHGRLTRFPEADGIPSFRTMRLFQDRDGTIWLGLQGDGGLMRFKKGPSTSLRAGTFTRFTIADGLPSNNVSQIMQDREGILWAATEGGLVRLTDRVVTAYAARDGLSADNVYPIYQDRAGAVWIGSWTGLTKYERGAFRKVDDRVRGWNVMSLLEDRRGDLWVGLWGFGGVARMRKGVVETFPDLPAGDIVRALHEDRLGVIWLGGPSGLTRYRDGVFTRLTPADGFPGGAVLSMRETRGGTLWIGADAGLIEYRDGRFKKYGPQEGFTGTIVRSLYEDADGVLWIGTYDTGLFRLADGRFTQFTTATGLFDNGAFQILEDGQQNFWISGNAGIYRVAKRDLNAVAEGKEAVVLSAPYGKRDGMITAECNGGGQPAGIRAADGRLWFPTQQGVVVIDPDHVPVNRVAPPVAITEMTVDGQPAPVGSLRIRPGQSAFEIRYAGLTFLRPELTRFRYKLEPLDTEWVDAGNRRTAYFAHVPFGQYTFIVSAANRDGVWNDAGVSIPIDVVPPFWRTRWFETLVAVAVVAAVFGLYRRRIVAFRRTEALRESFARQLIDSQEDERKRIAGELHDSLAQSLIVIKNWATMGAAAPPDDARARFADISATTSQVLGEVREIAHNLGPWQLERLGLSETIREMVERVSSASGVHFETQIGAVDGLLPRAAEIGLYRILQESVTNMVKHSKATRATVTVDQEAGELIMAVTDNGQGFVVESTGFGLVGIAERARLLGGMSTVTSAPGHGTRVEVRIPKVA